MGRFYKTSSPKLLDFTLKLPEEMMIQVVKFTDEQINKEFAQLAYEQAQLQGNALGSNDRNKLDAIFTNFQNQIDTQTQNLRNNLVNWRKNVQPINQIASDIYTEQTKGDWSKIQSNYNAWEEMRKKNEELVKNNPDKFRPSDIQELENAIYLQWDKAGGTFRTDESGNSITATFSPTSPAEYIDPTALVDELGKGFEYNGATIYYSTSDGQWVRSGVNGIEYMSEEELQVAFQNALINNQKLTDYLSQRYNVKNVLGLLPTDSKGNPVSFEDYYNDNLTQAINFGVLKYGFQRTEQGVKSMTADPYALNQQEADLRYKNWEKQQEYLKRGKEKAILTGEHSLTLFRPEDFNSDNLTNVQQELQNQIKTVQEQIKRVKNNGGDTSQLEAQLKDYQSQLMSISSIIHDAHSDAVKSLLDEGKISETDLEYYNEYDKRFDEVNNNYSLVKSRMGFVTPLSESEGGKYEALKTARDRLIKEGYSEQEVNQMMYDYSLYQKAHPVSQTIYRKKQEWFQQNQDRNNYSFTTFNYDNLISNDENYASLLDNTLLSGDYDIALVYNRNTDVMSGTVTELNTNAQGKKAGSWSGKDAFDFATVKDVTGLNPTDYMTGIEVYHDAGGSYIVGDIDKEKLKENGYKLKGDYWKDSNGKVSIRLDDGRSNFTETFAKYTSENSKLTSDQANLMYSWLDPTYDVISSKITGLTSDASDFNNNDNYTTTLYFGENNGIDVKADFQRDNYTGYLKIDNIYINGQKVKDDNGNDIVVTNIDENKASNFIYTIYNTNVQNNQSQNNQNNNSVSKQ